jgi:hypothetical protein
MQKGLSRSARRRGAVAAALIAFAGASQAAATLVTFDTDTSSNQQTSDAYGLAVDGGLALANAGRLHVQPTNSVRVTADIGTFAGNVTLSVDLGFAGNAGTYGMGFRLGDNFLLFHPGYPDGAFRIDGPDGFGNTSMGFTPTQAALNHMTLAFDAATARATVTVVDGLDPALSYQVVFQDTNYVAGVTMFGIEANGAGVGQFDNLRVETPSPVPEPAAGVLLAAGLACVLGRTRRRTARA